MRIGYRKVIERWQLHKKTAQFWGNIKSRGYC